MRLLHLVNPVKVAKNNQLHFAQELTFASMLKAKLFSNNSPFEIELCTTQYIEDRAIIPREFTMLSDLERSVSDFNSQLSGRKLPLIKDILDKANEAANFDYLIYTNVDIALMPNFYEFVFSLIQKGHDSIIINRRRIENKYTSVNQLNEMYAELGKSHPGFDCFIIKKPLLKKLLLDTICVGVPFIGVSMFYNLMAFSESPKIIMDKHLTFHLGMDVLGFKKDEYYRHNKIAFFKRIKPKLQKHLDINKFTYSEENLFKRGLKWALNPSLFTVDYLNLEGKSKIQKMKLKLDELRWKTLQK